MKALSWVMATLVRRNDVALAVLLMAVIFMMILPMPTVVVDTLIALNMALSVILLMVGIYLSQPSKFTAFPSLLLITTLFRLSLSITTTRLILLQADAGQIVETFGNFVVGGNLVVGLVVFLIITIVQFVVITKGAERVAEVGARFTLDAMPGKQMSIDGDMRAGTIDMVEAKRRRSDLESESQLYGAMDGAMKFVKGDAIAGLMIIFVNLVGGVAIGALQHGMPAAKALQIYAVLSIGDGLVAQIPALLIAITAGIVVTRVASEEPKGDLGNDIGRQILSEPKAAVVAAAILVGFALIPGFPAPIFLLLAAALGVFGVISLRNAARAGRDIPGLVHAQTQAQMRVEPAAKSVKPGQKREMGRIEEEEITFTKPLTLDVSPQLQEVMNPRDLDEALTQLRRALFLELGVPFPAVFLRYVADLPPDRYIVNINEIPVAYGSLKPGRLFAREPADDLRLAQIPVETGPAFLPRLPTLWVNVSLRARLQESGFSYFEPIEVVTYHISAVVKRHIDTFLGIQETKRLMDRMEQQYDELAREALRVATLQKIAEILKRVVGEHVSIRNMRLILETVVEWAKKEKDTILLVEYIRIALGRQICHQYKNTQNILAAYVLTPETEQVVRDAIRQTSSGSYLALPPNKVRQFIEGVRAEVGDLRAFDRPPVLICSMDVRRYIRRAIEAELYDLHVISYQELTDDVNVKTLGRIDLGDLAQQAA